MGEPMQVPESETWTIRSATMDAAIRITLLHPLGGDVGAPVPVLYVLDAPILLASAIDPARLLPLLSHGAVSPIAVAGVSRDEPDLRRYLGTREHDHTPMSWTAPIGRRTTPGFGSGGGPALLAALVDEVIAQVESRVDVDPTGRGIAGYSLSGLFATWAWRERPDLFARLLAISPSLWWQDHALLDQPMPRRPAGHRAFLAVGACEESDRQHVWPPRSERDHERLTRARMVSSTRRLAQMTTAAGARTDLTVFADEHHATVMSAAMSRGIRSLYAVDG